MFDSNASISINSLRANFCVFSYQVCANCDRECARFLFLCLVKKKEEENCFLFFKVRRDWTVDIKDRNASLQTAVTIFLEQA